MATISQATTTDLQTVVNANTRLRSILRGLAGAYGSQWPVELVDGDDSPAVVGNGYWFRWLGKWKTARGSYQASTRRIEVGADWLAEHLDELLTVVTGWTCSHRDLDAWARPGDDDRVQIVRPLVIYQSPGCMLITEPHRDGARWWLRSTIVQVVVRCTTTGQRHQITVPPSFARPLAPGETAEQRINDAIGWTFGMGPGEYRPGIES